MTVHRVIEAVAGTRVLIAGTVTTALALLQTRRPVVEHCAGLAEGRGVSPVAVDGVINASAGTRVGVALAVDEVVGLGGALGGAAFDLAGVGVIVGVAAAVSDAQAVAPRAVTVVGASSSAHHD